MQPIENNVWQPYQQIPTILSNDIPKISKLIDTLSTNKQARALIFLGAIQENNHLDDNALQTYSKIQKLYLSSENAHRQQILSFLITASARRIFILLRKKNNAQIYQILDSILDNIKTLKQYEQLCYLLFKVKSIVDLALYDKKNSVQYKFDQKIQNQFWEILQKIGQCKKTSNGSKSQFGKKKNQPIDVIISKMKQKQLYLIELANMSIIPETIENPVIPCYSAKALRLALGQQIEPFQSAIKLVSKNIEIEENSLVLSELSKTSFFKKAIENYKNKVFIIVVFIQKIKKNILFDTFLKMKRNLKKQTFDQEFGKKEWNICKEGQYIIKCNFNNTQRAQKYLWIHDKSIRWAKNQDGKKRGDYTEYKFKYVRGIAYGKVTPNLCSKQHEALEPWKCFSVICADRTLDFYCKEFQKDLLFWLTGITYHLHHYFDKNIRIYSVGRTLWKMSILKSIAQKFLDAKNKTDKNVKLSLIKKQFKLQFAMVKRVLLLKAQQQQKKSYKTPTKSRFDKD